VAVTELTFRVMASRAHVILVDPAQGAEGYARRRLEQLERRWSRFLPSSEISRLNSSPGAIVIVSPDTVELLLAMKDAWRLTGGRHDSAMLHAITAAGYAASRDGSGRTSTCAGAPRRDVTLADVTVDEATSSAVLPAGLGLDPGGIGKGLAADLVVTELLAGGTGGALVSVGGDLAAAGSPPSPAGWIVAVEDPFDASLSLARLALGAGGVATSSTLKRAWVQDGHPRHHVIDPDTQASAGTDLAAVTVVARAGWEAEAHATAALLTGAERVLDYFARHRLEGLATTLDGTTSTTAALACAGVTEGSLA
jgi:thiamine biosynthesis lipoprotein